MGSSISLADMGRGGDAEEEMHVFGRIVRVVVDAVNHDQSQQHHPVQS